MSRHNNLPLPGPAASAKHGRWVRPAFFLGAAIMLFAAGLVSGRLGLPGERYVTSLTPSEHARQFHIFWEAWQKLEQQFYSPTPLDAQSMTYGAIRGMVAALDDPYASLVDPPQHQLENNTFEGHFGGIGASIVLVDSQPIAVEVYAESAAQSGGLCVGDKVLSVGGILVAGLSLDQVALLIRGPVGTPVQLDVERAGQEVVSLRILRQRVEAPSLTWQMVLDGIGYIHVYLFTARTGEQLADAVRQLQEQRAIGLVIDLRGNGGGLTDGAIDVLGRLLGHGIAYRELGRGDQEKRHAIPFGESLTDWPLAVLVDGGTASAAEMVAAALQDYERGVLIGKRTLGKGSVQRVFQLGDGSSVHITTARWLSAKGYAVEGVGLQPDIRVEPSDDGAADDPALRQALIYLQQRLGRASGEGIAPLQTYDSGKVMV